ncbi:MULTISPECIES: glycoside hydrolase family 16 protein [Actinomycetes]|uniref:glycoside hydrolase family 16 protein n=1 Tax=Actinomycetes TaxID=1760 RepID=UPI0018CC2EBA|nr:MULTISPECIES: glycoside hydrolase family 16 protein [Actinomycetes]
MPTEDMPGWALRFTDDFDRCELDANWGDYSGQPGGNPYSHWDPAMVQVTGGVLELRAEQSDDGWVTGGVSNHPIAQQYGRWEVRMRAEQSADISYHMLLWPKDEVWPPEIDFAESVSATRSEMSAFLHWVDAAGQNAKDTAGIAGDFTQWHTVGVEWGPNIIRYLLDGRVWAEAHSEVMVPDVPMWLGMQAEAGACERRRDWGMQPCSDTDDFRPQATAVLIDWVAVYTPDMAALAAMQAAGMFNPRPDAAQLSE